jgi:pyruvate formate lyase activating enzyme
MIRKASYYKALDNGRVHCRLCPAECRLKPGRRGICRSRYNEDGGLYTDNFGETVTVAIDPIEKKPLYHFFPTGDIVSIGPNGCNLSCKHCQNWHISQEKSQTAFIAPEDLPATASQEKSIGIAYTYTEPVIWFEYIMEAAPAVKAAGMVNVMVSNGYINPEPLQELLPHIDAFNIDLKAMRPEFYRRICKGKLDSVLEAIKIIGGSPAHLEVTNLVIPGLNDSDEDFHKLGEFLASVDNSIPLHLSAYHPSYKLNNPPTQREILLRAHGIAKEYLSYAFVGNMEIRNLSNTYCPECGQILIERSRYRVRSAGLDPDGNCKKCGRKSDIMLVCK